MTDTTATDTTATDTTATAKAPVGTGTAPAVGLVLAVLLVALGVVAVRDALVAADAISGQSWTGQLLSASDGLRPALWTLLAGIGLLLLGAWLLLLAMRPRPRTGVKVRARTGVFLRPRDVARLAAGVAEDVGGVLSADASATRRTVSVQARVTGGEHAGDEVHKAVQEFLAALDPTPRLKVTIDNGGG